MSSQITHTHIHTDIHTQTYTHRHTHTDTHTQTCTHRHAHTDIHTQTYTHRHTHTSNIHSLAHIRDTCALLFSSCVFLLLQITTRAREGGPKEHKAKQKWMRETHSVTFAPGLSTPSYLLRIVAQPPPSFLCCPRPPSHHPSSLTSVYLVPPPTYFRHQHPSGHEALIHFLHMHEPSHYFLICSTR